MGLNNKGTTKANGRKHTLDKFYTKPEVAKECIEELNINEFTTIIEPSAGSGAFSNQIANCIALDLEPEHSKIRKQDFLGYIPPKVEGKILVIGNPPFGVQNNLAIKFFNHAASFADTIAFILPKSFKKESIHNRLNLNFVLQVENDLPSNSFVLNGEELKVPCVFQVWVKQTEPRVVNKLVSYDWFKFVKKADNPDFYIQRIGGKAGSAGQNWVDRSEQSNYFIKILKPKITAEEFCILVNSIEWVNRNNTVGPRSLSKKEIITGLQTNHNFI